MGVYGPSTIYLQYRLYMDTTIRGVYGPSTILTIWIIHGYHYQRSIWTQYYTHNIDYTWIPLSEEYMDPVLYLQYRLYMDTTIRGVYEPSTIYLQYRLYMDTTIMGVYGPSTIYLQYRLYMDTTIMGVYGPSTIYLQYRL